MKSQIILVNRGFTIFEIVLAISLFAIFSISIFTLESTVLSLRKSSEMELDNIINDSYDISSSTEILRYGNFTSNYIKENYNILISDYPKAWGRDNCNDRLDLNSYYEYKNNGINIGYNNISSDIESRNEKIYLTANSSKTSDNDFFIINKINNEFSIVSGIDTGPGVNALEIAGHYAYLANASSQSQLQIVDIIDRENPIIISSLKLPKINASTTLPFANSILYSDETIFLGTTKWMGAELQIIDVSDKNNPSIISSIETNTLVNDIVVYNERLYIGTSDNEQIQIFDIKDLFNPVLIENFSPSGSNVQEVRSIEYHEGDMYFGRTTGGFNSISNHELFYSNESRIINSIDIPGGVYGLLKRGDYILVLTHDLNNELQLWKKDLSKKVKTLILGSKFKKIVCDNDDIYFVSNDSLGFSNLIKTK